MCGSEPPAIRDYVRTNNCKRPLMRSAYLNRGGHLSEQMIRLQEIPICVWIYPECGHRLW
jgi:hypothetical protein